MYAAAEGQPCAKIRDVRRQRQLISADSFSHFTVIRKNQGNHNNYANQRRGYKEKAKRAE
jgi:hypothetical protein